MNINFDEYKGVRALSNNQFWEMLAEDPDLDFSDFRICQTIASYEGRLVMKKWGEKRNIIAFVDCTEKHKRKIKVAAFQDMNYLGLADIPMGSIIRLTYEKSISSRKTRLGSVEVISRYDGGAADE